MSEQSEPLVLVTGATGFLGHRLVEQMSAGGTPVRAAGRRPAAGFPADVAYVRLSDNPAEKEWRDAVQGAGVVVHCAARAHVLRETDADPLAAFRRVNVGLTMDIARAAVAGGVKRFVFVSSIGVCGAETFGTPFDHNTPAHPHSPYAVAKHEAEIGLRELAARTGLELVIVRPPLVYGPNAAGNFARLLKLVEKGVPMPFAAIANRRSLIGLDNLADFLRTCAQHPRAPEIVHTISDGPVLSTADLVRALAAALGRPSRLFPFPASVLRKALELAGRGGMAQQLCGSLEIDSSASHALLSWQPPQSMAGEMARVAQGRRSPKIA